MRYFFITQDVDLPGTIQYRDFDITGGRQLFLKSDSGRLHDATPLYLAGTGKEARPDFLQRPVLMFSQRLKEILYAYEPELIFKEVILIHKESSLQYYYLHTLMEPLDVLSDKTEYYPNRTVKKLVLDQKKIGRHHLFLPEGSQRKDPVVSLALAESLLRRRVTGICFEEVDAE